MTALMIKDLSEEVVSELKRRAERHGHDVEAEARAILEAALDAARRGQLQAMEDLRARLAELRPPGSGSVVDEFIAERRAEAAREND